MWPIMTTSALGIGELTDASDAGSSGRAKVRWSQTSPGSFSQSFALAVRKTRLRCARVHVRDARPRRKNIEKALARGHSDRWFARKYGLSKRVIQRHTHHPEDPEMARKSGPVDRPCGRRRQEQRA